MKANVDGVDFLMKKNKIDVINGFGSFVDATTVQVSEVISNHIILRKT